MRKTLAVFLVVGLFIAGMLAFGCAPREKDKQSTPQGTVEAFIVAFQQKDLETISGLYLNSELNQADRDFLSKLFSVVDIKGYLIEDVVSLAEEEAEVKTTITMIVYNREKTEHQIFRVLKKDRRWYLAGQSH